MNSQSTGIAYDAVHLLGFGSASTEPLPDPTPGEIIIRVGDWSLQDLRTCKTVVRNNLMWDQDWYKEHPFSREKLTFGIYRVRLPIPDSNRKNFKGQKELLLPGEDVTPVALVAVALLCHLKQVDQDLLNNRCARCAEALPDGYRVALYVRGGRVYVSYRCGDDDRGYYVWLAGCRKS